MKGDKQYEITTTYDERAYRALADVMMRLRRWPRFAILGTGLLSVAASGYAILTTGVIGGLAAIFLMLGNFFILLGLLAPRLVVRILMSAHKKGGLPKNDYTFYQEGLTIRTGAGAKEYGYASLKRVMDIRGYFVLFTEDGQVYLLGHGDLPKKEGEGLYAFLNERLKANRRG